MRHMAQADPYPSLLPGYLGEYLTPTQLAISGEGIHAVFAGRYIPREDEYQPNGQVAIFPTYSSVTETINTQGTWVAVGWSRWQPESVLVCSRWTSGGTYAGIGRHATSSGSAFQWGPGPFCAVAYDRRLTGVESYRVGLHLARRFGKNFDHLVPPPV